MIASYLNQLHLMADRKKIPLLDAFKLAGLPTSTYYRAMKLETDLRLETALKVADAIKGTRDATARNIEGSDAETA